MAQLNIKPWMRGILLLAGVYTMAWGIFMVAFPDSFITWLSGGQLTQETDFLYVQARAVLVFGVFMTMMGIKLHSWYRLIWLVVALKLMGPLITYYGLLSGLFSKKFIFHMVMNDLIWVLPLIIIAISMQSSNTSE